MGDGPIVDHDHITATPSRKDEIAPNRLLDSIEISLRDRCSVAVGAVHRKIVGLGDAALDGDHRRRKRSETEVSKSRALPTCNAFVFARSSKRVKHLRVIEPNGLARDGVHANGGLGIDEGEPIVRFPLHLEALRSRDLFDLVAVGRSKHLVPALELPEVATPRSLGAVVVSNVFHAEPFESLTDDRVEIAKHRTKIDERGFAARPAGLDQTREKKCLRRVRHEAHLDMLRNRIKPRQLTGVEYELGDSIPRRRAQIIVGELGLDGASHPFDIARISNTKTSKQQRAVVEKFLLRPRRVVGDRGCKLGR